MDVIDTEIADVKLLIPSVFADERGFFMESYHQKTFQNIIGQSVEFVQDNHSRSARGVLRGLHYQVQQAQGKLVRVTAGEVFDVAVDLRSSSSTFGQSVGVKLTAIGHEQLWIPAGFAHGFVVLSDTADFLYKMTAFYAPEHERAIKWNDADLAINWNIDFQPILSQKDSCADSFKNAEKFD